MKEWFNSKDLAGASGLPNTTRGILIAAKREGWKFRKKTVGKGKEYHISSLPKETQMYLRACEQPHSRREAAAFEPTAWDYFKAGFLRLRRKKFYFAGDKK